MLDHGHPYSDLLVAIDAVGEVPCERLPEVYFPEDIPDPVIRRQAVTIARQLCAECPLAAQCLEYALTTSQAFGIWGGLTPTERHRLRAQSLRRLGQPVGTPQGQRSARAPKDR